MEKALENVAKSLKDGSTFVAEFGGKRNIQSIIQAMEHIFEGNLEFGKLKNVWYFPDVNEYKALLEKTGFNVRIHRIKSKTNTDRQYIKLV